MCVCTILGPRAVRPAAVCSGAPRVPRAVSKFQDALPRASPVTSLVVVELELVVLDSGPGGPGPR
eukprot:1642069-Pyramimonas_sp.AAC.1